MKQTILGSCGWYFKLILAILKSNVGKVYMVTIFDTGLKYLRPVPAILRVMTKDKTKIRLRPFMNGSKAKINIMTGFCAVLCQNSYI